MTTLKSGSYYDEDSSSEWECAICRCPQKQPKLLPCSHTFCKECLEGLVRNQPDYEKRSFLCPVCREKITVPSAGVAGFKNNIYLSESEKVLCENHPPQERRGIELYCLQCSVFLCWKCKNTHHLDHVTEEVEKTAERRKGQVAQTKDKLQIEIDLMEGIADSFRKEHKAIREKSEAVKKEIVRRYDMLIDMLTRYRKDALFSLDTVTASIESQLPLDDIEKTVEDLKSLHERMEDLCSSSGEATGVLKSADKIEKDVQTKAATVLKVRAISTAAGSRISRPVLRYTASADTAAQTCKSFLGTVAGMDMSAVPSVMKIKQQFESEMGKKYDIYSLLPSRTLDTVCVAYDTNGARDDSQIPPEKFKQNGSLELWTKPFTIIGRTSFTITGEESCIAFQQDTGFFQSNAKSRIRCFLRNNQKGSATVIKKLDAQDPLDSRLQNLNLGPSDETKLALITCGPHRSFDIHDTELIIAIVEEYPPPATTRSVVLFVNGQRGPYTPPIQPYLPSDVCFYKLRGRDVLLVADELNDTVHVVDVETGHFLQFLAPGCPLVIQPTALGVDVNTGYLWVACRGGALLVGEP